MTGWSPWRGATAWVQSPVKPCRSAPHRRDEMGPASNWSPADKTHTVSGGLSGGPGRVANHWPPTRTQSVEDHLQEQSVEDHLQEHSRWRITYKNTVSGGSPTRTQSLEDHLQEQSVEVQVGQPITGHLQEHSQWRSRLGSQSLATYKTTVGGGSR